MSLFEDVYVLNKDWRALALLLFSVCQLEMCSVIQRTKHQRGKEQEQNSKETKRFGFARRFAKAGLKQ